MAADGTAEFIWQVGTQTVAHRLARYAATRSSHHFYPAGICEDAIEVGPCTDRAGPCLVHFKGCSLTPAELNAWLASGPAACNVVRVFWLGPAPSVARSREELVAGLAAAAPAGGAPVRLQCYPRSLEQQLVDELDGTLNMQPVDPAWVLHVVQLQEQAAVPGAGAQVDEQAPSLSTPQQQRQQRQQQQRQQQQQQQEEPARHYYLYSLQPAADLYQHAFARGKRVPDQLSKAAGKLAEALAVAGVELTWGTAVDLGAAPGGWTHVLAGAAQQVIAVDPAELDERALLPNVTHLACKAQDAVARIHELAGERGIDLLVSDVNRHPDQLAELVRPLLPLLHPGGAVVLTLKFFGRSSARHGEWREQLAEHLGPEFPAERAQVFWLLANTQHEQTFVAWKAGSPNGAVAAAAAPAHGTAVEATSSSAAVPAANGAA